MASSTHSTLEDGTTRSDTNAVMQDETIVCDALMPQESVMVKDIGEEVLDNISSTGTDETDTSTSVLSNSATSSEAYTLTPWFLDAKYNRYWKHEAEVRRWFAQHTRASRLKQQENLKAMTTWCDSMTAYHQSMAEWLGSIGSYYSHWYSVWRQSGAATGLSYSASGNHDNYNGIPTARKRAHHHMSASPVHLSGQTSPEPERSRTESFTSLASSQISHGPASKKHRSKSKRKGKRGKQRKQKRLLAKQRCSLNEELSCELETNEDAFEMEITNEMLEFFTQSAKHKIEMDAVNKTRQEKEDIEGDYVNLGDMTSARAAPTVLPPGERPGVKRTSEMRQLYGAGAAMIHGMETAMQLTFDRNCDRQQPRLWPNIPISIEFRK